MNTTTQADREVYAEYCAECRYFGTTPKTFRDWLAEDDDDAHTEDRYGNIWDMQDIQERN